jgi:adenosylhomocysteinase
MDMSFANQLLSAVYLASQPARLACEVHNVPAELDQQVARLKLAAMAMHIDSLSDEQQAYLGSWQEGT